jgi:predicted ATP-dependent endonuclease of OLD family
LGVEVEYNALSSGEKDAIAMMFPLIEKQIENELARAKDETPPSEDLVVLIDGPEEYLHPSLQRSFLGYIREHVKEAEERGEKLQFILATHSSTLVNEAESEELFMMLFPDQVSTSNQLIKVSTTTEKLRVIREVLGDISLLAAGKPVLLMEGPLDIDVLRILIPSIERKFTLLPLYGKQRIETLINTLKMVISELTQRGFTICAILDRDHYPVGTENKSICSWPVTCIENLLLLDNEAAYEALKALIGPTRLETKGIKTVKDLGKLIEERIIKNSLLIEREVERRLSDKLLVKCSIRWPLTDNMEEKLKSGVEEQLRQIREKASKIREEVEKLAQEPNKARREYSGKYIIGDLAREFNVRRDELSRLIASKLRELDRVPPEVVDTIGRIA